jgi:hypothetical protein
MFNRSTALIGSGLLNVIHAGTHIVQFVQSLFLISYSEGGGHNHDWLHNPWMSLVWGLVGISTLILGIKDYKHHKKCKKILTY